MTCKEAIYGENVYDYITDFAVESQWRRLPAVQCVHSVEDNYSLLYIDKSELLPLENGAFEYQSVPKLYGLMETVQDFPKEEMMASFYPGFQIDSGIYQVQNAPLRLQGEGVVICIIDTGIDYNNPAFIDEDGNTRILAIWDQTIEDGQPPEGFFYGAEYRWEDINRAIHEETGNSLVPSRDQHGHGTAMACVAAGGRVRRNMDIGTEQTNTICYGAAPKSQLVVVKLKRAKQYLRDFYLLPEGAIAFQENDIMQAVQYCETFVKILQSPIVICLGIGSNMGDHNGNSALARYLSQVAIRRSQAVVICGGNEGNTAKHYHGRLANTTSPYQMPSSQEVEVKVGEDCKGFCMELWGSLPDVFTVSIRTPGGETIPDIRLDVRQSITYGFVYEKSKITIDSALVEPSSGEELIMFRLQTPTAGIWTFRVTAVGTIYNGEFDLWLPISQFIEGDVYFLKPDPDMTVTEPAMGSNQIVVGSYDVQTGGTSISSGRGQSRMGIARPDFVAPGENIPTIRGMQSGSSMAAALTAGAVAQLFQWAVVERNQEFAESMELQSYLIRGAKREIGIQYPNTTLGYGKLDMEGVFQRLRNES